MCIIILYVMQVYSNGYISMGTTVSTTQPEVPGPYDAIVVPYGADIDSRQVGHVRYGVGNETQLIAVSEFIEERADNRFQGTKMLIAEWIGVPRLGEPSVRFSASLI